LYCTFRSVGLLSFYIFFESRLIPTLLLILGWGYQPECVQAGIYLFIVLYLIGFSSIIGWYFVYLQFFGVFMFIFTAW
jgi:NADH-ubiquinone oxidoreductase chain 4